MQIEYNFTPDDLLAFSEYHNRRFPAAKRQVWIHRFLPPVLVADDPDLPDFLNFDWTRSRERHSRTSAGRA